MRYSVVLPRVEKTDSEAVVRALEQAHLKWECGDQTSALDLVRAASEAALAAGMKDRALALTKASAALGRELEPGTRRPPPMSAAPQESKTRVLDSVVAASRETRRAPRTTASVQSAPLPSAPAGAAALPTPSRASMSTAPVARPRAAAPQGAQPKPSAAPRAQVARASATAKPPPARSRSAPSIEVSGLDEAVSPGDLLVTVAASDWQTGVQVAVVGRRAERVVVKKTQRPDGTMEVRPLAPGEVAPAGSQIALLVSLGDPE